MKHDPLLSSKVFILVALFCTICASKGFGAEGLTESKKSVVAEETKGVPRIQFDELFHDLGKALQNQTLEHLFTFKNTGTDTLRIQKVKAG